MTQVSVVGRDLKQENQQDHFTVGEAAKQGAITGASIGGLFGLLIDVASVWVPGFGPLLVAGPVALALLGGIERAIAGAVVAELLSAMSGHTVSEQYLAKYNEALKHGNCLVIVTGTTNDIGQAHHLLQQTRTTGLKIHNEACG
jgi:lysophospholipase L1-like esterase